MTEKATIVTSQVSNVGSGGVHTLGGKLPLKRSLSCVLCSDDASKPEKSCFQSGHQVNLLRQELVCGIRTSAGLISMTS